MNCPQCNVPLAFSLIDRPEEESRASILETECACGATLWIKWLLGGEPSVEIKEVA